MTLGYVPLTLSFEREGNTWVGVCLEIGTSTFAKSLKQCQQELQELIVDHLNVLEEIGERERFFEEWDIVIYPSETPPTQFTIRGSGGSWDRLFQSAINPNGPFLWPRVFPLDRDGNADREPVSA